MPKWKVYISSTFLDLKDYRTTLKNLFDKQLAPSFELSKIMEHMFDDGSQTPFKETCIEAVLDSDIYIIILGNKTGSFPPDENRTYTEIEFDTATKNNKKVFCLCLEKFDKDKIDNKEKHQELLDKFKGKYIHKFKDPLSFEYCIYNILFPFAGQTKEEDNSEAKIENYKNNHGFRNFLISICQRNNVTNYHNLPPFIFGDIIKVLDVDDRNPAYGKYKTIGEDRFWMIKEYFYAYFFLCKYSILSILWDEIRLKEITTPYTALETLLNKPLPRELTIEQGKVDVNTLSQLCSEILNKFGKEKENTFIKNVTMSFELFEKGFSIFQDGNPNSDSFWNAELLLHDLMVSSEFLNDYRIRSIRTRNYSRYRNDERAFYTLKYFHRRNQLAELPEENGIDERFVNIYSPYLCQENDGGIVINLSPFYFDKNSHDENSIKIKLMVFDKILYQDDVVYLNYLPIYNPREQGNIDSNANIAIGENNIISDVLQDIDNREKKIEIEKEITKHKIKKIYEQFHPFLNVISSTHE